MPTRPPPRLPMHATDVTVVQLAVLQSASASRAVGVTSEMPKLMPVKETVDGADPRLCGDAEVMTGPAEQHERWRGR